jgi:hypothetical protein
MVQRVQKWRQDKCISPYRLVGLIVGWNSPIELIVGARAKDCSASARTISLNPEDKEKESELDRKERKLPGGATRLNPRWRCGRTKGETVRELDAPDG